MIEEISEFTFVHCTSLREVFLPATLHTIRVLAFMNCAALVELAIPPSLKCIGSRAFLDCIAFRRLVKMPGTRKWRGVYAEENAFAICPAMKWPPWLHMIPDMGHTPGLGQRNTLPTATVMAPLSFFQSLGASRSSGPEWARSCETDSSPRVTSHSGPPLDRGVSASLLSDREGLRPIFYLFLARTSLGSNQ